MSLDWTLKTIGRYDEKEVSWPRTVYKFMTEKLPPQENSEKGYLGGYKKVSSILRNSLC